MHGSQFVATWRNVDGEWMVQLEPRRAGGRLPPRGAVLDVAVRRKDNTTQDKTVVVTKIALDGAGRARVALAVPEGGARRQPGGGAKMPRLRGGQKSTERVRGRPRPAPPSRPRRRQ